MKFILVLSTLLVATYALPTQSADNDALRQDFLDLAQILPIEKISETFEDYLYNDAEWKGLIAYLQGPEFAKYFDVFGKTPQMIDLLDYLEDAGLDAYFYINLINIQLGLDRVHPASLKVGQSQRTGGLAGLYTDLDALIPYEKFAEAVAEKVKTSPSYSTFVQYMRAPGLVKYVTAVLQTPSYADLKQSAINHNIDVVAIKKLMSLNRIFWE